MNMNLLTLTDDEMLALRDIVENAHEGRDISGLTDLHYSHDDGDAETDRTIGSLLNKIGLYSLSEEVYARACEIEEDAEDED